MAMLGTYEVDPKHYAGRGSAVDVHDNADEVPDDLIAIVYPIATCGNFDADRRKACLVSWHCPDLPDSRKIGAPPVIRHYLTCEHCQAAWREWRDAPGRPQRWQRARLRFGVKTGDRLPRPAPTPPMVSENLVQTWLEEHRGQVIDLGTGERATPLALDVDSLPERTTRPVAPLALLIARRRDAATIVAHRGMFGLAQTLTPREAVAAWFASEDRDITNSRDCLRDDAHRLGAKLVYGVRGTLPPPPPVNLEAEVRALRERLARLEGRTQEPAPAAADPEHIRF